MIDFINVRRSTKQRVLILFDPPSRQIAKTAVWASPPTKTQLLTTYFRGWSSGARAMKVSFQTNRCAVQCNVPKQSLRVLCNLLLATRSVFVFRCVVELVIHNPV